MLSVIVSIAKRRYYEPGNAFASELDELGYNGATDLGDSKQRLGQGAVS